MDDAKTRLSALENDKMANNTRLTNLENGLEDVSSRITTLETMVSTNKATFEAQTNKYDTDIQQVNDKLKEAEMQIE